MGDGMSVETTGVYSKYSNKYMDTTAVDEDDMSNGYMDFDGYLKLLVAQMSNQDFNDPMSDSEMLNQMAQYSMLEGIKNMTQQSNISYASSLVGKVVTVCGDDNNYVTGTVDSITVYKNKPYVVINGEPYECGKVSDIVSSDAFEQLKEWIGHTVKVAVADEEGKCIVGKVTNVLFLGGEGYIAVKGNVYPLAYAMPFDGDEDESGESGSVSESGSVNENGENVNTENTEGAGTAEKPSDPETFAAENNSEKNDEELVTETSDVSSSLYMTKSRELTDILLKELDKVNSAAGSQNETNNGDSELPFDVNYILQTAYLEVPNYSAGLFVDDDLLVMSELDNSSDTFGSSVGSLSSVSGTALKTSDTQSNINTSYYNTSYSSENDGITRGDGIPQRKYAQQYPAEAALADELGTRMYDIRFINNRAITSRINTSRVIGRTRSGKNITEIGYSGVGQLGEVVTFSDGTQRVEILLKNGNSCWLHTSGNLTLDEICTKNGEAGSLAGKLTPQESAIRHFSRPMSEYGQSALTSFSNYLRAQGIT